MRNTSLSIKNFIRVIFVGMLLIMSTLTYGSTPSTVINNQASAHTQTSDNAPVTAPTPITSNAVAERAKKEKIVPPNFFTIGFYKPNYVMPYYYTGSPYSSVYDNQTPQNEKLTRDEIKYQFSLKVPLWKNIFSRPSTLYLAYTQLSYWQAYNKSAFFRETDYEPELFLANEVNINAYNLFSVNFLNIGAEHQSNGFGNDLERSWNRVYLEGIFSRGNLMFSLKPWFIIHDSALLDHNPDIGSYLGYFQALMSYKLYTNVITLRAYGLGVHGGSRTSAELSDSFPLTAYINGYVQIFSGYGQSLIEYNHRTNSIGIGISFSNWI